MFSLLDALSVAFATLTHATIGARVLALFVGLALVCLVRLVHEHTSPEAHGAVHTAAAIDLHDAPAPCRSMVPAGRAAIRSASDGDAARTASTAAE